MANFLDKSGLNDIGSQIAKIGEVAQLLVNHIVLNKVDTVGKTPDAQDLQLARGIINRADPSMAATRLEKYASLMDLNLGELIKQIKGTTMQLAINARNSALIARAMNSLDARTAAQSPNDIMAGMSVPAPSLNIVNNSAQLGADSKLRA